MASLLSWIGKTAKKVEKTVGNDIVRPVQAAVAQINPVDNNRTYKTVMQHGATYAPQAPASALNQIVHSGASNFAGGLVKPVLQFPEDVANIGYNKIVAPVLHTPHFTPQQTPGVAGSLSRFSGATGTPRQTIGSGLQTALTFGTDGLASGVEKGVGSAASRIGIKELPKIVSKPVAGAATGAVVGGPYNVSSAISNPNVPLTAHNLKQSYKQGTISGAALGAGAGLVGVAAPVLAKAAVMGVKTAAPSVSRAVQAADQKAFTPRVPANEQLTLQDLSNHYAGTKPLKPAELSTTIAKARTIGQQHGIDISQGSQLDRMNAVNSILDKVKSENRAVSQGGYAKVPGSNLPEIPKGRPGQKPGIGKGASSNPEKPLIVSGEQPQTELYPRQFAESHTSPIPAEPGLTEATQAPVGQNQIQAQAKRPLQPPRLQFQEKSSLLSNNIPRQRGFTTSVKSSDEVSPTVRGTVTSSYTPRNTAEMAINADEYSKGGLERITQEVNDSLAQKTGTINDQQISNAIAVAKRHDANGTFDQAQQIYDKLAEHGTKGGQQIQAFSLLRNRTPEGMKFQAIRAFKKAGVELNQQEQSQLSGLVDAVKKTASGTPERDLAIHNMFDFVSRKIPTNFGDKLTNFWRAGLLTSPVTTAGNLLGNATEAATRDIWTNPVAAATDKFFSMFTGQRTKTLTGGQISGGKSGLQKGTQYMKTGFDPRRAPNLKLDAPNRVNYNNKVLDTYVNGVYRWMGAQDQPFYYAAERQATRDLATADAKNLKLTGRARADYITNAENTPGWKPQTFKSKSTQEAAAKYAVYQNDTLLGHMAGGLKQYASQHSGVGGAIANFLLPFSQVPSSVAMRIIDRTPLGIAKEVATQFKNRSFDQRAMAEAVANGTFALPVVAAGAALARASLITGAYPTDPKEQQLWKSEGKQAYSVKVGNRWYSLNYMQPFGTIMAIGGQFQHDISQGSSPQEAWNTVAATALNSVESQSFLQGINGVLSAVNDPNRSATQYITTTASSVVPNLVRTGARATDPNQRVTKGAIQGVQGAVPGLREKLPVKQDMFGNPLPGYDTPANQLFNPFRPSKVQNPNDPIVNELQRLQDTQNGIIPTHFDKNALTGVKLNDQQVRQLNTAVNSKVHAAWQQLITDPRYQQLSDEDKATALKHAKDQIGTAYKRQFAADNNLSSALVKPPTSSTIQILSGSTPDFVSGKQSSSASSGASPADKYKAALATYNANQGSMSDYQRYSSEQNLAKLKVQSPFSNDVVSLYGQSKAKVSNFLNSSKDGQKLADQLKAYDNALYQAGLIAKPKFSNGFGTSSGTSKGRKKTSSKTSLASYLKAVKSANAAIKPPKPPKAPHIAVKKTGLPSTYKKTTLKRYAVAKPRVSKGAKVA